jgi:spore maturation protein B
LVAIGVFRASGALELLIYAVRPITDLLKIPSGVLPLMFMRPISGSASQAITFDILKNFGPDSFTGKVASTMMGSSETIFYTLAVYFGYVGIKDIRYTLKIALIAEFVSVLCSVWVNALIFGWK